MIRALENNTLGVVLASICGALMLAVVGLVILWALPAGPGSGEGELDEADMPGDIASLQSAKALEEYAVVSERPVFNEDRRPAPVIDEDGIEEPPPPEYVGAPDVELAGIIITPSLKMATLKSKDQQESLVAFEGKPLEGDFGTWQVSRIEERMVTLASAEGEEMQLELQVHDAVIKEPPKPAAAPDKRKPEAQEAVAAESEPANVSEPMTRAEEIRQRIEERREELRQAAESRDSEQAENYREAIQSMIQRSREREKQQQESKDEG